MTKSLYWSLKLERYNLMRQQNTVLSSHHRKAAQLKRVTNKMSNTTPKPFVFVLMPFAESFNDIYKLGIKPACESAGAYCERVDEQIFQESILDRVYNQIAKADLIISEMTGRNPNVFYETGYAHALGKKVILLTKETGDIPFDLQHYPHIIYNGKITLLKEELEKRVSWFISQPAQAPFDPLSQLKFYTNGEEISRGVEVQVPSKDYEMRGQNYSIYFNLSFNNAGNFIIDASDIVISLVLPSYAQLPEDHYSDNLVRLPDGTLLARGNSFGKLYPQAWYSSTIRNMVIPRQAYDRIKSIDLVLRIFTPVGVVNTPFSIKLEKKDGWQ
jgi:hypothetical protein